MNLSLRTGLLGLAGVMMLITLYMAFLWVPNEATMGAVQRIMYFHVPIAIIGFVAAGAVFVASIAYLIRPSEKWDAIAYASAEVGVLFISLMLLTGTLWGKATWGIWWDWSPRLTTSLIMWFLYVAYLMLRAYAPKGVRGARYAAVLGIFAMIDVPLVYMSTTWWRDVHPQLLVGPAAPEGALDPTMRTALLFAMLTFLVLYIALTVERYYLRRAEEETERMQLSYEGR
ncbi:MAG: cytochrome C assembly protein [Dehalococcoidia bacterium]|nr:cytochrome C assembly protein [Dehalococcoidia bacterium]